MFAAWPAAVLSACSALGLVAVARDALAPLLAAARARSYELERQNLSPEEGRYTLPEYRAFMLAIARDNAADPLGYRATLGAFDDDAAARASAGGAARGAAPASILEVGPGSGDFARMLAAKYPNATVLGVDASEFSIEVARSSGEVPPNLRFELRSSAELDEPPQSVDVVTTTFVNHEIFPDANFVDFLRRVRHVGRKAFIFNDYVRSPGCLVGVATMSSVAGYLREAPGVAAWLPGALQARAADFLAQTPSVQRLLLDGAFQSMRRSFTMGEYEALFRQAGYPEGALRCGHRGRWSLQDLLGGGCRVACRVDLSMGEAYVA